MSPQLRYKFRLWLVVSLAWLFIGFFFSLYDLIVWDYNKPGYIVFLPESTSLGRHIMLNLIPPALGALVGASLIVFYLRDRFKKFSYGQLLIFHALVYLAIIVLVAFLVIFINSSIILSASPFSEAVLDRAQGLLVDYGMWKVIIFWFFIVILTVFMLEVNDKYGPGVLMKLIKGSYHKPRQEFRVFMFLDLKSATTLAEKIGSEKYFLLLKAFFADVTSPIMNTGGDIYQYVGDEITVCWEKKSSECLECYFEIRDLIAQKKDWYLAMFGSFPEFKVGMHCGIVTIGEIGLIKKEIVYSGDVLNTSARLMEACKEYKTDILLSEEVKEIANSTYDFKYVGEKKLRGKERKLNIHTVE